MGRLNPIFLEDQDIEEVSQFLGLDFQYCKEKIISCDEKELALYWRKVNPKTPEEIKSFYTEIDFYIFRLTQANKSLERKDLHGKIIDYLFKNFPPNLFPNILDYGSGVGEEVIKFAENGYNVTFTDIPGRTAEFVRFRLSKRRLKAKFIPINEDLPILRNKYDIIICFDVLEHVWDPRNTLRFMARHLNRNGVLAIKNEPTDDGDHPCHLRHTFPILSKQWDLTLDYAGLTPEHCNHLYKKAILLRRLIKKMRYYVWRTTSLYIVRIPKGA